MTLRTALSAARVAVETRLPALQHYPIRYKLAAGEDPWEASVRSAVKLANARQRPVLVHFEAARSMVVVQPDSVLLQKVPKDALAFRDTPASVRSRGQLAEAMVEQAVEANKPVYKLFRDDVVVVSPRADPRAVLNQLVTLEPRYG